MKSPRGRRGVVAAVAVAALGVGRLPAGWADPATDRERVELAEAHYVRGSQAVEAGRLDEALREFRESYAMWPRTQTLYNIAVMAHKVGRSAEAANHIVSYLEQPDHDPELATRLTTLLAELDRGLGRLHIETTRPGAVRVDGVVVGRGPGPVVVRVDPGAHEISQDDARTTATAEAGRRADVPLNAPTARTAPAEPPPPLPPPPPSPAPSRLPIWLTGAGTLAAAGAATYFALATRRGNQELDRFRAEPGAHEYADVLDVRDDARRDATLANVLFGVTAAGAITTGVLIWRARRDRRDVRISLVPTTGGALVRGHW